MGFSLSYSSEHPADAAHWLDYVALTSVGAFLGLTALLSVSTVVFSLQKRGDILLKAPVGQLLMYAGAVLQVVATASSYLPLPLLQVMALPACVLFDYWFTLGGVMLWCLGNAISLSNNILGCMDIMEEQLHSRLRGVPSPGIGSPVEAGVEDLQHNVFSEKEKSGFFLTDDEEDEAALDDGSSPKKYQPVVNGLVPIELDAPPLPPMRTSEAVVWSRRNRFLRRIGCTWRFGLPGVRIEKVSSKIQGVTMGCIAGYILIFLTLCLCAQYMHASRPTVGQTSKVLLCESGWEFKMAMTCAMISFVALSWTQLLLMRRQSMVPRFCSGEYLRMMTALTVLFVVTLVINLFGATRYFWGRFLYIELVLVIYLVAYYCISGRVWKDVLRRHRLSDKQIVWQLGQFVVPKHFRDILDDPLQREFMYRDFSAWMIRYAQPAFVPHTLRLGSPQSLDPEAWTAQDGETPVLPLHGSAPAVADSHFLVFPTQLLLLFEATARYMRSQEGSEVLPARLTQDHARNVDPNQFDRLAQDIDQEKYATGIVGWLARTRRRVLNLWRREDKPYRPEHFERQTHATDTVAKHFLQTTLSYGDQSQRARELVLGAGDRDLMLHIAAVLPTLSCEENWFHDKLLQAHAQSSPEYFREVFQYLVQLFDHYYFPLFMRQDRVTAKLTEISDTRRALAEAAQNDRQVDDPFRDEGLDGGLSRDCIYDTRPRQVATYLLSTNDTGSIESLELERPVYEEFGGFGEDQEQVEVGGDDEGV